MKKSAETLPPIEILRRYFRVDSEGRIQRKFAKHGWKQVSRIRRGANYATVAFEGRLILAHRLVWTLHYGRYPEGIIDHINGLKGDNRIENLREATRAQNRWNCKPSSRNATGFGGVFQTRQGAYRGRATKNYVVYETPEFDDPELAELAGIVMRERLYGEFAWVGATGSDAWVPLAKAA